MVPTEVKDSRTFFLSLFSRYYHLVSWGIPFVVACLPLINDHYGPAGAWW